MFYVDDLDGSETALPAIEWYNENMQKPLFNKGVVSKRNIEEILEAYSEKVHAARASVKALKQNDIASSPYSSTMMPPLASTWTGAQESSTFSSVGARGVAGKKRYHVEEDVVPPSRQVPIPMTEVSTSTPEPEVIERIPQTVVKAKVSGPRAYDAPSSNWMGVAPTSRASSTSTVRSRKRSQDDPAARSRSFRKFLERKRLSSAAPSSSMAWS